MVAANDEVIIQELDGVIREIEGNGAEGEMAEYFRRTEEEMLNFLAVPEPYRDGLNTPHVSTQSYGLGCDCIDCQPVAIYGENFVVGNGMNENYSTLVDRNVNEGNEQFIFNEETVQFAPEAFRLSAETENNADDVPGNNIN